MTTLQRCSHSGAVPVESDGVTVAALCPICDRQLPAAWLTCDHEDSISVRQFGGSRRRIRTAHSAVHRPA